MESLKKKGKFAEESDGPFVVELSLQLSLFHLLRMLLHSSGISQQPAQRAKGTRMDSRKPRREGKDRGHTMLEL